jgi:hypothetical protein
MTLPCKPHPIGNGYHSIADSDDGKPIMRRVKIVEGKDHPKKADGSWAFPLKWEQMGFTKMVNLLLKMTGPIHHTGKIVTGNRGFCIADGVVVLHKKRVHGQFLIKKQKYWPKFVPGNHIDEYMSSKPLGYTKTFIQVIKGTCFFFHCTQDDKYVT